MLLKSVLICLTAIQLAAGHGAIVKAVGDQGGTGKALGIDGTSPRDGTTRNPFQQDSNRFKNGATDACCETLGGGMNGPPTQVPQMLAANGGQMAQTSAGGMVMMTLHEVNVDAAGPYECMIDSTGAGTQWTDMALVTNIPSTNSNSKARATNFPLTAKIAATQSCTGMMGGMEVVCMVRCNNAARAGPFGGCVPIQMASAARNVTADVRMARSFQA